MSQFSCIALFSILAVGTVGPALADEPVQFVEEQLPFDSQRPAVGTWLGNFEPTNGDTLVTLLILSVDEDDQPAATITMASGGIVNMKLVEVSVSEAPKVSFEVPSRLTCSGEVSADGQWLKLRASQPGAPEDAQPAGTFTLHRSALPTELDGHVTYEATLAGALRVVMTLAKTDGGNWVGVFDSPSQGAHGLPLYNFEELEPNALSMKLPVPGAPSMQLSFNDDGSELSGSFQQAGQTIPVTFTLNPGAATGPNRPQHPVPPFPYDTREIVATHPDGFHLAGTLTIPDSATFGEGPFPTAVLISGSGQQDRDETVFEHKPFAVIADYLTRHGIAVMRYDDRGVGGSAVDDASLVTNATSADFATDARAVVETLKEIKEVDSSRIGLIGHSEGGMIAPMVATDGRNDIAFVVLLAGPGVNGRDLLALQTAKAYAASGGSADNAKIIEQELGACIDLYLADGDQQKIDEHLHRAAVARATLPGASPEEVTVNAIEQAFRSVLFNPWSRYFFQFDPAPVLSKLTCPVLAMNGEKDLQVWHEQNLDRIALVLQQAHIDATIKRYPSLNHLFQPAERGTADEYASIPTTFDETALHDMTQWILSKVRADDAAGGNEHGK